MDLIERQKAMEAFENTTFTKNEILRRLSELPSAQPEPQYDSDQIYAIMKDYYFEHKDEHDVSWQGGFGKCMNLIPNVFEKKVQPQPRWIPVMERLPEIKQRVLITYNTEDGLKTDVTWYDKYGFLLSGDVTAWMPMVEPYKEESGE